MDRRLVVAMLITFGIFFAWQKFVMEPKGKVNPPVQSSTTLTEKQGAPGQSATIQSISGSNAAANARPIGDSKVQAASTPQVTDWAGKKIVWGTGAKAIQNWEDEKYPEMNLQTISHVSSGILEFAVETPELAYLSQVQGVVEKISNTEGTWTYEDDKVSLKRTWQQVPGTDHFKISFLGRFKTVKPKYAFISLESGFKKDGAAEKDRRVVYWADKEVTREVVKASSDIVPIKKATQWMAITDRYFVGAVVNRSAVIPTALLQPLKEIPGNRINLVYPIQGDIIEIPLEVYIGPKKLEPLRQVEPSLDHVVDFGFFTWVAYPILKLLNYIYKFIHNYGVAIIIVTILLKIVTFPLTYKSMKSMQQMAKIQPQMQRIKEKFANDKQAQQREMMALMRSGNYNPLAGCLPILIQMPVFFALYQVLYSAMELYKAPFMGWIHDLSLKDPYFVTPILMTALMWFQQKLTPSTVTDPVQKKMFQWMPVFFGLMMLGLPSGLTLYMLTNSIAGIVQQVFLNKKLGIVRPKPEVINVKKSAKPA